MSVIIVIIIIVGSNSSIKGNKNQVTKKIFQIPMLNRFFTHVKSLLFI